MALVKVQISANQASAGNTDVCNHSNIIGDSSRVIIINTCKHRQEQTNVCHAVMDYHQGNRETVARKMQSANTTNPDVNLFPDNAGIPRFCSFTQCNYNPLRRVFYCPEKI
jgi:hypothetical protein